MVRSALVTGATRGIGRGIATSLARKGFELTVTARNDDDLRKLAIDLNDEGAPKVVRHAMDLAQREGLPHLVRLHENTFGSMNALIINAGVGTAGSVMAQYGLMMGGLFRERFAVDYAPLAEALLLKALELDTANARWPTALEQFRNLRQEVGRAK